MHTDKNPIKAGSEIGKILNCFIKKTSEKLPENFPIQITEQENSKVYILNF